MSGRQNLLGVRVQQIGDDGVVRGVDPVLESGQYFWLVRIESAQMEKDEGLSIDRGAVS